MPRVKNKKNDSHADETTFYPEIGTAFHDKSNSLEKLLIVEPQEDISVLCHPSHEFVAFSFSCGQKRLGDFHQWVDAVKSKKISVIWCPVHGRIADNNDYISKWNL